MKAHDDLTFNMIGVTMAYYDLTFNVIGATVAHDDLTFNVIGATIESPSQNHPAYLTSMQSTLCAWGALQKERGSGTSLSKAEGS